MYLSLRPGKASASSYVLDGTEGRQHGQGCASATQQLPGPWRHGVAFLASLDSLCSVVLQQPSRSLLRVHMMHLGLMRKHLGIPGIDVVHNPKGQQYQGSAVHHVVHNIGSLMGVQAPRPTMARKPAKTAVNMLAAHANRCKA